ncbi:hypothetical protein PJ267_11065 [Arthrobacter sp. OVS8]|nr:hypothetical protein PJ267_11065 [Arthrobacter sp. OVS8]
MSCDSAASSSAWSLFGSRAATARRCGGSDPEASAAASAPGRATRMPSRPCLARIPAAADVLVQITPAAARNAASSSAASFRPVSSSGMCSRIQTGRPAAAAASSSSGAPQARSPSTSVMTCPASEFLAAPTALPAAPPSSHSSAARRFRSAALPTGQPPSTGQVSTSTPRAASSRARAAL